MICNWLAGIFEMHEKQALESLTQSIHSSRNQFLAETVGKMGFIVKLLRIHETSQLLHASIEKIRLRIWWPQIHPPEDQSRRKMSFEWSLWDEWSPRMLNVLAIGTKIAIKRQTETRDWPQCEGPMWISVIFKRPSGGWWFWFGVIYAIEQNLLI